MTREQAGIRDMGGPVISLIQVNNPGVCKDHRFRTLVK